MVREEGEGSGGEKKVEGEREEAVMGQQREGDEEERQRAEYEEER